MVHRLDAPAYRHWTIDPDGFACMSAHRHTRSVNYTVYRKIPLPKPGGTDTDWKAEQAAANLARCTDTIKDAPAIPTDAAARKNLPLATGVVDYFPLALLAVAECSKKGNDQHNPGKPLHWDRSKSGDESDALMRHFVQRGTMDSDGIRHSAKVAWRALALLQKELEAASGKTNASVSH